MSSLYFIPSHTGYIKKTIKGELKTEGNRQIGVYKRVNEYMFGQPKEVQSIIKEQVDEDIQHHQQKSARSLDSSTQNNIKYVMVQSTRLISTSQNNPLQEQQMDSSVIKQRQNSLKDTSASQIQSINRKDFKISIIQSQFGRNDDQEIMTDRSYLQNQIQKQKALRKNLQHSYHKLLQKYKQKQNEKDRTNLSQRTSSKINNNIMDFTSNLHHQKTEYIIKPSRSKTEISQRPNEQKQDMDEQNMESIYEQHLRNQKYFRECLMEQIQLMNQRIEGLETNILKSQGFIDKDGKQTKVVFQNKPTKVNITPSTQLSLPLPKKTQLQYIFFIFIMFLIVAMSLKNRSK